MERQDTVQPREAQPTLYVEGVPFAVGQPLGEGGYAKVYAATAQDRNLGPLALRIQQLPSTECTKEGAQEQRESAIRQYRFMQMLNQHPGIAQLLIFGVQKHEDAEILVGVMPRYEQGSLRDWMQAGRITNSIQSIQVIAAIASSLQHAHDNGVIHRDIKPDNILVGRNGEVVVSDFDLAVPTNVADRRKYDAGAGGTPNYMAPEQWDCQPTIYSDQYGVGVMAYEIVTGHLPFTSTTRIGLAHMHRHTPVLPFSRVSERELTPMELAVESVIMQALAKNEHRRHISMRAFGETLEDAAYTSLPQGSEARAQFRGAQAREWARGEAATGHALALEERFKEAVPYYERALTADPMSMKARAQHAAVLESMGRTDEARAARWAACHCPLREEADLILRGCLLTQFGYYSAAIADFSQARGRGQVDTAAYRYEVEALERSAQMAQQRGRHEEASTYWEMVKGLRRWLEPAASAHTNQNHVTARDPRQPSRQFKSPRLVGVPAP